MCSPNLPHSSTPYASYSLPAPQRPALGLCHPSAPPARVVSSLGFRLSFERVTSKRTCLQRAQPDPEPAPRPDSRQLGDKGPTVPPTPRRPQMHLDIRRLSFHSSAPYRPRILATRSSPGPLFRRGWGWGTVNSHFPHPTHLNPLDIPDDDTALGLTSEPMISGPVALGHQILWRSNGLSPSPTH
jgi:hypothetical protein